MTLVLDMKGSLIWLVETLHTLQVKQNNLNSSAKATKQKFSDIRLFADTNKTQDPQTKIQLSIKNEELIRRFWMITTFIWKPLHSMFNLDWQKCFEKNEATLTLKLKEVPSKPGWTIEKYTRYSDFTSRVGRLRLHPTKGTHWMTCKKRPFLILFDVFNWTIHLNKLIKQKEMFIF